MYLSTTSIIAIILITLLLGANILYYRLIVKRMKSNKLRLLNFINRILLLIYLLFFYMHWPYREYILYSVYFFAAVLFLIETIEIIIANKKKADKFYWIDSAINILLILLMLRTYVI